MQQRRLRPGDVLDDYCPRERRITDHAIVAMIEDDIKQTRCVSCDTEHEYKQGKVPVQRRKKAAPALFTQVLDGLQGPLRIAHNGAGLPDEAEAEQAEDNVPSQPTLPRLSTSADEPPETAAPAPEPANPQHVSPADASTPVADGERALEEGPVRRPLIRAQLPRHEGQPPPTRDLPDFTIRQPSSNRGNRPGGGAGGAGGARPGANRRRGGGSQPGQGGGATRFGNQSRSNQFGRSNERRHGGRSGQGQGHGQGPGQGQGQGQGQGRPDRGGRRGGGKKH